MKLIESAGGILIEKKKVLLCKRSINEKRFPRCWGCPAGKRDNPKESFNQMAIREVKEESGLDFSPGVLFGVYEMDIGELHIITHLFLGEFSGDIDFDENEVEECEWFDYQEAKKLELSFFYGKVIDDLHEEGLF